MTQSQALRNVLAQHQQLENAQAKQFQQLDEKIRSVVEEHITQFRTSLHQYGLELNCSVITQLGKLNTPHHNITYNPRNQTWEVHKGGQNCYAIGPDDTTLYYTQSANTQTADIAQLHVDLHNSGVESRIKILLMLVKEIISDLGTVDIQQVYLQGKTRKETPALFAMAEKSQRKLNTNIKTNLTYLEKLHAHQLTRLQWELLHQQFCKNSDMFKNENPETIIAAIKTASLD